MFFSFFFYNFNILDNLYKKKIQKDKKKKDKKIQKKITKKNILYFFIFLLFFNFNN